MNLTKNLYFDPNPLWMFVILKIWCVLAVVLTLIGFYVVPYNSPRQMSKTFGYLLLYHLSVGMFFQLTVTVLTPPLILLPFGALEMPGVLTALGVPVVWQVIQLFTSIIAAAAAICPLFYYRMDILLPHGHFFNKKIFRYLMYFFVYGVCYTLFAPLLYMTVHYEDQNRVKQALEMEYQMTFDNLWSPYVVVAKLDDNPFALFVATVILMLCAGSVVLVVVCSTVIYYTVKSKTGNLSIYTKKHHIVLLKSLLSMIALLGSQVTIVIPTLVYMIITHSRRADLANILVSIAGGAYPGAIMVYAATYPPYRQFYVNQYNLVKKILCGKQATVAVVSRKQSRWGSTVSVQS